MSTSANWTKAESISTPPRPGLRWTIITIWPLAGAWIRGLCFSPRTATAVSTSSGSSSTSRSRNPWWRIRRMKWLPFQRRTAPPIITSSCRMGGNRLNIGRCGGCEYRLAVGRRDRCSNRPSQGSCYAPAPSNVCVVNEHDGNHLAIYAVDPDKGKGRELAQISVDSPFASSALSPDGSRLAITMEDRIRILTLKPGVTGASEFQDIFAPGRNRFRSVSWSPDAKGLYVACWSIGRTEILYMDFNGRTWSLWEEQGEFGTVVLPSPDGRHLAFHRRSSANNAWMMKRF